MGLKSLKVAGHDLLHRIGIDINKYHPRGSLPTRMESRRIGLMRAHQVSIVLDVGANTGQYASSLRKFGYSGRIVSFEPVASSYNKLASICVADPNWECRQLALGAEPGSAKINVAANHGQSSSILPMCERHVAEAPYSSYVREESIQIETLDNLLNTITSPSDRLWLKLDVQGFEFSVIDGAARTMPRVQVLEMEMSTVPLYKNAPLIHDALNRIVAMGFTLVGVEEEFVDSHGLRSLQLGGIFERN